MDACHSIREPPQGESHGVWKRDPALDFGSAHSDHPFARYVLSPLKSLAIAEPRPRLARLDVAVAITKTHGAPSSARPTVRSDIGLLSLASDKR